MKHERSKHVDNQSNKKEAKLTNTSQELKWDPGVGIDPLTQLKEVEVKHGANMGRKTQKKNQQIYAKEEKEISIHNTQEGEKKYAEEEENTIPVKGPDITTGSTRNNQDILPYTKYKC